MTLDEIVDYLISNGVFCLQGQRPITIYDKPAPKLAVPVLPMTHPIMQYKNGQITKSQACKLLGTDKSGLFRLMVEKSVLFD